ncbi:MAG TPA: YceI family protein [Pyrinomonadaceae bacterium]|nr:YceI family protein [Pyrinomonadaceae bacterium]
MSSEAAGQLVHYQLDPAASKFTVQAFAEGLLSMFGHDPVIGVKDFQGEASFVPGTFENASLKLVISANSLRVVNDLKEKDRQDIERTMRDQVLETGKYPEIVFQSTNVSLSRIGGGRYRARVIGDLTLHGVTQSNIWINGEVTLTNDGLKAKGDFAIKQTDYKIELVSVAGGTLKIKNEVKGRFDILARR